MAEIDVQELKERITMLLDGIVSHLKVERLSIDPKEDFYWDMHDEQMFDVSINSPEIVTGRLTDDLEFVRSIQQAEIVPLMLDHVAPLLRYLAHKLPGYR